MSTTLRPPRPELLALLQAAKDEPGDDAPRLVLADWLEEHGDEADRARAAFIRLQIARDRLRRDDPAHEEIQVREQELYNRHAAAWLGPMASGQNRGPW